MIKSITVTNYLGSSITLELARPGNTGFIVRSIEGLGPVKANINMTQMATVDGSRFNSAKADPRNIVITLEFMQTPTESIEEIRQKSYKYFPLKKPLGLTIETDANTVETSGYVESNEPNIFSDKEATTISILCPDSYLYSKKLVDTVFSGVEPAFEFPFENNSLEEPLLEFGIIKTRTEGSVYYEGDSDVGMTIHIYALGEASNITIYNLTTREEMRLNTDRLVTQTGSGISAGDSIIIDTRRGKKSATLLRNGVRTNILNCIDKGSTWFRLTKGDNIFAYIAANGGENLDFRIKHNIIYEGI